MKFLSTLILCLVMMLQAQSQTLSKNQRIKTIVTEQGDTLLQMKISDAKKLLSILLEKEVNDDLLATYIKRDSLNQELVTVKDEKIKNLQTDRDVLNAIIDNLNQTITNNEEKVKQLQAKVIEQEKDLKKERFLKKVGFIGCILLPVLTILFGNMN